MSFLAKIKENKLDFGSHYNFSRWEDFKRLNEGRFVRIEKPKQIRTLKQNALYWLFLELVERETGNDAQDLHAFFSKRLLPNKIVKIHGKKGEHDFERVKSTTELSKNEFTEYMDKISSMTEVAIPDTKTWLESNGYITDSPMRSEIDYPVNNLGESPL